MKLFQTVALAASLLAGPGVLDAQEPSNAIGAPRATRVDLLALARELESDTSGGADTQRATLRKTRLAALQQRLAEGDFLRGDRIVLRVGSGPVPTRGNGADDQMLERQLTDTFTVNEAQALPLPQLGAVSLRGILRSELDAHLTREVTRLIHAPSVQTQVLVRVAVHGGVARPGYYSLPTDADLADALAAAGGSARGARLTKMNVRRGGKQVYAAKALQQAIADGRSLEELGMQAGDELIVPERRMASETIRTVGVLMSIPLTVLTLMTLL